MIIASALLMVAAQSGGVEASRVKYANCVAKTTIEHLKQKTPKPLFEDAARAGCSSEKDKYVSRLIADEVAFGSSKSEAAEYANEEAEAVVDSFVNAYTDYLETNTIPALE